MRNPQYFGTCLSAAGLALIFNSLHVLVFSLSLAIAFYAAALIFPDY